jgi:monoamine oxidase
MQAVIRRKLSMAGQVLAFERAHPSTDPSHQVVVTRLAALVGRVDEVFTQERMGTVGERAAARYRRRVRRGLRMRMRHLVHVGAVAAVDDPHLTGKFVPPPTGCPNRVFLGTARALLLEATAHHDTLLANGLGTAFLIEFAEAIKSFERASIAIDTGRRDHVAARVDFTELARTAVSLVRLLHGLNSARFAREPEVLAAWESAREAGHPKRRRVTSQQAPLDIPASGVNRRPTTRVAQPAGGVSRRDDVPMHDRRLTPPGGEGPIANAAADTAAAGIRSPRIVLARTPPIVQTPTDHPPTR